MKFFVDTAEVEEIKELIPTGFLDGVTTNPSLVKKAGKEFIPLIEEICGLVDGPVSAEVAATDYDTMIKEGKKLAAIAPNVAVKVPLTQAGLRVCKELADDGTMVNVTLCFSANQALLAAKAGAAFISPFIGRLDDIGHDGMQLISEIVQVYDNYGYETEVLAASIRHPFHVFEAAKVGADVSTIPADVIWKLFKHPLTDKGLDAFVKDWAASGQKIL